MKEKRVELLAPAGSPEGLYGAIHAGADAVYLGGDRFSARAYANNFNQEELIEGIQYAQIKGRKIYLAVNTLVKEQELKGLSEYILPFYEAGLHGVIVQDFGVFAYLRRNFPDLPLHASTQMTITGTYAAKLLKEMGAVRIVPARELQLDEIRQMKEVSGLEIETFVHGAMCYSYSGQCLLSSLLGGRSGNRGRCAQPCRLPYQVSDKNKRLGEGYVLSLKDMCMIEHLPELIKAGIDSFKIEGRMKKPEYTAGVTALYRKYLDRYYDQPEEPFFVEKADLEALSGLYLRSDRHTGYYFNRNGARMVTIKSPSYGGMDETYLEEIRNRYLFQKEKLPITIYSTFRLGEPAQVSFQWQDYFVSVQGASPQAASKAPVTQENIRKQLGKLGDTFFEGEQILVTMDENIFYPLKEMNELRRKAVDKLLKEILHRNSPKRLESSEKESKLAIEGFEPAILPQNHKLSDKTTSDTLHGMAVRIRTIEQLEAVYELISIKGKAENWYRIYLDSNLFAQNKVPCFEKAAKKLCAVASVYLSLPYILREEEQMALKEIKEVLSIPQITGCMVHSTEGYGFLKEQGYGGKLAVGAGLHLWNHESMLFWQERVSSAILPLELTKGEQLSQLSLSQLSLARQDSQEEKMNIQKMNVPKISFEKMVYGRIPMMITANCVLKTVEGCRKKEMGNSLFLTDRYGKNFPVTTDCRHCYNVIYNSVPLSLHRDFQMWKDKAGLVADFTVENKEETFAVLSYFSSLWQKEGMREQLPYTEYTTGHDKRGVE